MQKNKPDVSIIIVHYKVEKELFACIDSVKKTTHATSYEIIVVDNDEEAIIGKSLKKQFPDVLYIKSEKNIGWGGGTMLGASYARGEYLYFLNPDCIVYEHAIDAQYSFISSRKNIGVVSSLLFDSKGNQYPLQGTAALTPLTGIVGLSIVNTLFPNNPFSRKFWLKNLDKRKTQEVPVVQLSSAIIRKNVFKKVGGFDHHFFLYFEEYDLSKKLANLGLKSYIFPEAKVMHEWGVSSKKRGDIQKIFRQSRFYYFQKYYGFPTAFFMSVFLEISKLHVIIFLIFLLGLIVLQYILK